MSYSRKDYGGNFESEMEKKLKLFYLTDRPKDFLSLLLCVTVPSQLKKTKELGHPDSINRQSEQLIAAVTKPVHPAWSPSSFVIGIIG